MLKTKEEIKDWLEQYHVDKFTINEDLTVDVAGNVHLYNKKLTDIPVKFNIVSGYFECSSNDLKNLDFFPEVVKGAIYCAKNEQLGDLQRVMSFDEIKKLLDIRKQKKKLDALLNAEMMEGNHKRLKI